MKLFSGKKEGGKEPAPPDGLEWKEEERPKKGKRAKPEKPKKPDRKPVVIHNINTDNYIKPKSRAGPLAFKIILWGMLGFIFVRGVVSILKPDPLAEFQSRTDAFIARQEEEANRELEIYAFAANFVKEYLTYQAGGLAEYTGRVGLYTAKMVNFAGISNFKNAAAVTYAQAYRLEQYSREHYNVYVMATVEYATTETVENEKTVSCQTATSYVIVPVKVTESGYVVVDYPLFTAEPARADTETNAFMGREAGQETAGQLQTILNNFLRAWYGSNQTSIDYFLSPEAEKEDFRAIGGRYEFNRISSAKYYENPKKEGQYLAVIEIIIQDINGQQLIQRFHILFQREGTRFYVLEIDTKSVDIKYDFTIE